VAQFEVNAYRFDPYKGFRFRLRWDGHYVAGISKVSVLKRMTEVVEHRAGGDQTTMYKSPGQTKFEPLTLERGVTHDVAFEDWASLVWKLGNGSGTQIALKGFRKDLILELHNEAGQVAIAYKIYRAWVSEFTALPELDASANAIAIQSIILQHEGFERDLDTPEPSEPSTV
jgi:phage tail-like protein